MFSQQEENSSTTPPQHFVIVCENFSVRSLYGLCDNFGTGPSDALIALTMIVGTYVEVDMVFPVIPVNQFFVGTNQRVGFLSG